MSEIKLKKAMYKGKLPIANLELDCYVLDDETRILSASSVFTSFSRSRSGLSKEKTERAMNILNQNIPNHGWSQIPPFLGSKGIISLININDIAVLRPVEFLDGENKMQGYRAELLPRLCSLYLEARRNGTLDRQQSTSAKQAEILLSAFANVGIIALIDEATGFQINRKSDALRIILKEYVAEGIRKWLKRFPDKFFEELDRLYGNEKTTSRNRPLYYAKFINSYVWEPIEAGIILEDIQNKNPITSKGYRKHRNHQHLTDFGLTQLSIQIGRVLGVAEDSKELDECKLRLARQKGLTIIEENLFGSEEKIIKKPKLQNNPQSKPMIDKVIEDNKEVNEDNDFQDNLKKFVPKG